MSAITFPSLRFGLFIAGQMLMTIAAYALLFNYLPFLGGFALVVAGGALLGFGSPNMNTQMQAAFPLRLRVCLFLFALLLIPLALLVHRS